MSCGLAGGHANWMSHLVRAPGPACGLALVGGTIRVAADSQARQRQIRAARALADLTRRSVYAVASTGACA